jgi:hypothetical protein
MTSATLVDLAPVGPSPAGSRASSPGPSTEGNTPSFAGILAEVHGDQGSTAQAIGVHGDQGSTASAGAGPSNPTPPSAASESAGATHPTPPGTAPAASGGTEDAGSAPEGGKAKPSRSRHATTTDASMAALAGALAAPAPAKPTTPAPAGAAAGTTAASGASPGPIPGADTTAASGLTGGDPGSGPSEPTAASGSVETGSAAAGTTDATSSQEGAPSQRGAQTPDASGAGSTPVPANPASVEVGPAPTPAPSQGTPAGPPNGSARVAAGADPGAARPATGGTEAARSSPLPASPATTQPKVASALPAAGPSASHGPGATTPTASPTRPAPASGGTPAGPNPSAIPGPAPVPSSAPIPGTMATAATHGHATDASRSSVSPADQVVRALGPLRTLASGNRSVTLALEPDGLGTVRATVVAGSGTLSVTLQAATPQGYAALQQGLGQLHHELGNLASKVQIDLRQEGQGGGSQNQQAPGRNPGGSATTKPVTPELSSEVTSAGPSSPMGGRLVDLRL